MRKLKSSVKKRLRLLLNRLFTKSRWYNQRVFTKIYRHDLFNTRSSNDHNVSKSGSGSDLEQTKALIEQLPVLFQKYKIQSLLDLPCGDFFWMQKVDLTGIQYIGGDIVADVIKKNNAAFASEHIAFREIDIINDDLPKVDLILCRDLLVHLKNQQIIAALKNIKKSGSKYLLTTSFKNTTHNQDNGVIGFWRTINLELEPFNWKYPIDEIFENCTEGNGKYNDKYLLLYQINP
ncbi:class I SAM-dependent methyltransferase [Flavobacterium sedimenticola]|uniref:Class I SAM-dependent methyltransferase n=1 Tax=Flavobacterium sedimenticola TaxID=3043286 RepID=A0ABT6XRG3_9FLAO|nr:class I SAM-dependent methyltransferase [Flavobacterium sedimenticola]MDI9257678.1 class I SAM-dependent methyltransferase [Flavobacterium sedimenticola]